MTDVCPQHSWNNGYSKCRADYQAVKGRLGEVGFICEGSLVERDTTCNNPNCRCAGPNRSMGPTTSCPGRRRARRSSA